jgi:hypothetical protein
MKIAVIAFWIVWPLIAIMLTGDFPRLGDGPGRYGEMTGEVLGNPVTWLALIATVAVWWPRRSSPPSKKEGEE